MPPHPCRQVCCCTAPRHPPPPCLLLRPGQCITKAAVTPATPAGFPLCRGQGRPPLTAQTTAHTSLSPAPAAAPRLDFRTLPRALTSGSKGGALRNEDLGAYPHTSFWNLRLRHLGPESPSVPPSEASPPCPQGTGHRGVCNTLPGISSFPAGQSKSPSVTPPRTPLQSLSDGDASDVLTCTCHLAGSLCLPLDFPPLSR